jgi:hypothetical protein
MKKYFISAVMSLVALVMLGGCATQEERAARAAAQAARVKTALAKRDFKINIDRMFSSMGGSKNVSYGYQVAVRNDSLISHLPYLGRAYNIPYGGGKGLNFSERISKYQESKVKNDQWVIDIELQNEEDTYIYTIRVFDNGNSSIDVVSRQRQRISYSGNMEF